MAVDRNTQSDAGQPLAEVPERAERFASTGTRDDAGVRAGSYDRKFNEDDGGSKVTDRVADTLEEGKERVSEKADEAKARLSGAVDSGRSRLAGGLEQLGDTLEERARTMEEQGGVQRRAGQVARRAGTALDSGAEYIRSHEPGEMRDDLERQIRDRPLLSIGIAAGAGFLLARILRD